MSYPSENYRMIARLPSGVLITWSTQDPYSVDKWIEEMFDYDGALEAMVWSESQGYVHYTAKNRFRSANSSHQLAQDMNKNRY